MVLFITVTSFLTACAVRTGAAGGVCGLDGKRDLTPNHRAAPKSNTPSTISTQRAREDIPALLLTVLLAEGMNSLTDICAGPCAGRMKKSRRGPYRGSRQAI